MSRKPVLFSYVLIIVFIVLFSSCHVEPLKYMQEVETNNNYIRQYSDEEYQINCYFRPAKYMALRELIKLYNSDSLLASKTIELESKEKAYSNGLYFELRFALKNHENIIVYRLQDRSEYAIRIDYLNQSIYNDFYLLLDDLSKVKPLGHAFQNTFGVGNFCDITLVFPKERLRNAKKIELIYSDRIFYMKNAKLRFSYDLSDLIEKE